MAWYLNHYSCDECGGDWSDPWSCMCDDECPHCGARHMSPVRSDDLTEIIVARPDALVFLRSPDTAEHDADYREVAEIAMPPEIMRNWHSN